MHLPLHFTLTNQPTDPFHPSQNPSITCDINISSIMPCAFHNSSTTLDSHLTQIPLLLQKDLLQMFLLHGESPISSHLTVILTMAHELHVKSVEELVTRLLTASTEWIIHFKAVTLLPILQPWLLRVML
jgi:hypothetical protein